MKRELVIVIDFGGQYNQLVARRVRECNVYCEIYSYKTDIEKIKEMNPKGIILTGGPNSCYEADSPTYKKELFELGIPVLGLCYGAQLMMHVLGGKVELADVREYGKTEVLIEKGTIEIAPLAYMRGRTLDDCYVILDEAQNTTTSQMKMFLTRLGFNSKMIITGDITQIDLEHKIKSGLEEASAILKGIDDIAILHLSSDDVVRHPLVQKIIERYESIKKD